MGLGLGLGFGFGLGSGRVSKGRALLEGLERVAVVPLLAPEAVRDPLVKELAVARHLVRAGALIRVRVRGQGQG